MVSQEVKILDCELNEYREASHIGNVRQLRFAEMIVLTFHSLDTAGTEQFTAMRELYMKQGQGFMLVFSITNINSFYELSELRDQIVRIKDDNDVPLVVVGNKCDMEEDRVIPRARGFDIAKSWGNKPYFETSARRRVNVDETFVNLCRQIIQKDSNRAPTFGNSGPAGARERYYRDPLNRPHRRLRKRERCVIL